MTIRRMTTDPHILILGGGAAGVVLNTTTIQYPAVSSGDYANNHFVQSSATAPLSGPEVKSYYFAGAQLVAVRTQIGTGDSTLNFLHSDHLGSTSLATDASGAVVPNSRQLYDAWGNLRVKGTGLPTDVGYTGQRLDATGLMYYRARYYDSYLNRWLSPDTIVPDLANPQSLNRFSYVRNNPLKYVDPSGHREIECDPGEPGCGANGRYANPHDLTSYLAGAMTAHGQDPRLKHIADGVNPKMVYMTLGGDGGLAWLGYRAGRGGGAYTQFLELEGTKKEWDIKQKILRDLKEGIILCGEVCDWYDYSTPGNIHFGYVAGLAGIDHGVAAVAGGLEQTKDD